MGKKETKSGNMMSFGNQVQSQQRQQPSAINASWVSGYASQGLVDTSTPINQANDILYLTPTQISPNSLQNCGQPQYILQNQTVNRSMSSNMNMNSINTNNANNTFNPGLIQMTTAQSPTLFTSAQTINNGGNIATGILQRLANQNAGQANEYDLIQQMNSQFNVIGKNECLCIRNDLFLSIPRPPPYKLVPPFMSL